uniref:Reverse transcriptase n=1 Tax=Solanum tuberosum TaxID=4113 RepID=M1DI93_SOLTU
MAAQKRAEEVQARSKGKKGMDPVAVMISSYKSPIDDSIFADLSPFVVDLTISDHEKSESEKEWGALIQDITNGEDWFFQTHGFSDPILVVNDQVVPGLYSLKDGSPTDDYLRCDEHLDDLNLEHLDDIDLEHEPKDNYPSDGYIEESESSTDSQEYVDDSQEYIEETAESSTDESSLEYDEEDYPPIFMNHHKEPAVSEVDDDQDDMTDDPISERRPEPTNTIPKNVGTRFHTFTLDNVKVDA